eukprot:2228428-Prymnesium_polylepis.1
MKKVEGALLRPERGHWQGRQGQGLVAGGAGEEVARDLQQDHAHHPGQAAGRPGQRASSVRVMCNGRPPPDPRNAGPPEALGNAQPGEILTATMAGCTPEQGSLVCVVYHSSEQPNPNGKLPVGPVNLEDQKLKAAVVPEATLRAVFASFDKNANGTLSLEELQAALCRPTAAGTAWSENEVIALMRKLDKNGDGVIDYNEWLSGDMHTALPGGLTFLGKLPVGPVDKAEQAKDKLAACVAEINEQMGLPTQGSLVTQFGALAKALGWPRGRRRSVNRVMCANTRRARCAAATLFKPRAHLRPSRQALRHGALMRLVAACRFAAQN